MLAGTMRRIPGPRRDREEELAEEPNSSERKGQGRRGQRQGGILWTRQQGHVGEHEIVGRWQRCTAICLVARSVTTKMQPVQWDGATARQPREVKQKCVHRGI